MQPDHAALYRYKGAVLLYCKRYKEALKAFEKAISLNPDDDFSLDAKATILATLRFDSKASRQELFRFEIQLSGNESEGKLIRIPPFLDIPLVHLSDSASPFYEVYLRLSNSQEEPLEEILALVEQLLRQYPNDFAGHFYKGQILLWLQRSEDALVACEQALHLNSTHAACFFQKGSILYSLQRIEEALAAFEQAIRLKPNAISFFFKGVLLSEHIFAAIDYPNNLEPAIAAYEQARHLNPYDDNCFFNLSQLLRLRGRYKDAQVAAEQAAHLNPPRYGEKWEKTLLQDLNTYDGNIRNNPKDAQHFFMKSQVLLCLKRNEEARAAAEQAINLDPVYRERWAQVCKEFGL